MDIPQDLTNGLKVVGTIPVSLSSNVRTTTLSYSMPSVIDMQSLQTNVEVSNNLVNAFVTTAPIKPMVQASKEVMGYPIQVEVATPTTDSPNVFVLAMTVEDTDNKATQPVDTEEKKEKEKTQVTQESDKKTEEKSSPRNPLDTTLTSAPEPQRASTPNVNEEDLNMINDTIVAGSSDHKHLKGLTTQTTTTTTTTTTLTTSPIDHDGFRDSTVKNRNRPTERKSRQILQDIQKDNVQSKPTKDTDVDNKTYCKNWILNSGQGKIVQNIEQSDSLHNENNVSDSLLDVTSVSRNVTTEYMAKKEKYFYSKQSANKDIKTAMTVRNDSGDK